MLGCSHNSQGLLQDIFPLLGLVAFPILVVVQSTLEKVLVENVPFQKTYKDQLYIPLGGLIQLEGDAIVLETVLSCVALAFSINSVIFSNATIFGISTYLCLVTYKLGCSCEKYLLKGGKPLPLALVSKYSRVHYYLISLTLMLTCVCFSYFSLNRSAIYATSSSIFFVI